MKLKVNEKALDIVEEATLGDLAACYRPGADVLIKNGFPCPPETPVGEGDEVVLIRRGETPSPEEMETLMASRHTPGVHARIKTSRVGVAGVGGLGSQVVVALARIGVGNLVIADFDVVEPSNLNRQQYFIDQLGLPKVDALGATLARINPYVEVTAHKIRLTQENISEIFEGCAVVVEAFDRADQKAMLVETVLTKMAGVWMVAASGLAGYGPSETVVPNRLGRRLIVVGDLESEARPGVGLMAPRVGVAAHVQANTVLRILLGEET